MEEKLQSELKERYMAATESFIDNIRDDPNVIAAIVGGSLAYDMVWEKSDIDMTLIVRDQLLKKQEYCIMEDGITINVYLMQRSAFKRGMERNIGGSMHQSYFAKGKMVYSTDDSLYDYFEEIRTIGGDDVALSMLYSACELISQRDKCMKWLTVRKDPLYAQYYLLKAAEVIARMEVCLNREPFGRDSIQRAVQLNPEVLNPIYSDPMSHHMSEEEIRGGIRLIDEYLVRRMEVYKQPVLDFMADQEVKTMTLISNYFHSEGHFLIEVFDYLAEQGVIEKVSQTIRITPKSRMAIEEIGYLYVP
jgi:hypothetical protein